MAQEVGLKTYPLDARRVEVDWNPSVHNIDAEKESIAAAMRQKWAVALNTP